MPSGTSKRRAFAGVDLDHAQAELARPDALGDARRARRGAAASAGRAGRSASLTVTSRARPSRRNSRRAAPTRLPRGNLANQAVVAAHRLAVDRDDQVVGPEAGALARRAGGRRPAPAPVGARAAERRLHVGIDVAERDADVAARDAPRRLQLRQDALAWLIGIEKPMLLACRLTAELMPTTSPAVLSSGPPLLPKLIAASVWM